VGRTVNSAQLLPAIRDLYSRRPEYFHHESWELAHVLFSPGLAEAVAICKETRRSKRISLWWGAVSNSTGRTLKRVPTWYLPHLNEGTGAHPPLKLNKTTKTRAVNIPFF
jgi:hypothetical protein